MPYMSMEFQPSTSGWTHPYDVLSDASNSHAAMQESSQQIHELSDVPTKPCMRVKPQPSTSERQLLSNVSPPASTSHAAMQESSQQIHEVSDVSRKRKRTESKASTSGLQSQCDESSHAPQQEVPQQFPEVFGVPMYDSSHYREEIKKYLELGSRLERAATNVFNGDEENVKAVVETYRLKRPLFDFKMDIMKGKERYWKVKVKIEEAVKHVVYFSEDFLELEDKLIEIAAKKVGVTETELAYECNKYKGLNDKTYE